MLWFLLRIKMYILFMFSMKRVGALVGTSFYAGRTEAQEVEKVRVSLIFTRRTRPVYGAW